MSEQHRIGYRKQPENNQINNTEKVTENNTEKVTESKKTAEKTVEKTVEKMLKLMAENPFTTTSQLSESIGFSISAINQQIEKFE